MTSQETGLARKGAEEFDASEARRHFGSNVTGEHSVVPFNGKKVLEPVVEALRVIEPELADPKKEIGDRSERVFNPTERIYSGREFFTSPQYKDQMARDRSRNWTKADREWSNWLGDMAQATLDSARAPGKRRF